MTLPTQPEDVVEWRVSSPPGSGESALGYDELAVFVANATGKNATAPVQGRFTYAAGRLVFAPYYPFEPGLTYAVRTKDLKANEYAYRTFRLQADEEYGDAAELLEIYPTADVLPENLLRLYFTFSSPMKKGEALEHIQLVDSKGDKDTRAFMQFKQELWSPDGKRLTLLFDPGRIKRGVSTNLELGPALREGNTYRLVVSGDWQDVHGRKLGRAKAKTFSVGPAYRTPIDSSLWNADAPEPDGAQPLVVRFDRIMDHALIRSMIRIENEKKQGVGGAWESSEGGFAWLFWPSRNWQEGHYVTVVDSRLEDVAGNNLSGLLDQTEPQQDTSESPQHSMKFVVRAK